MKTQTHKILLSFIFVILFCSISFAQTEANKGIELFNKGDYKASIEELNRVVEKDAQNFEAFYYLGFSSMRLRKNKDAKKYFEKSLSINPDYFESDSSIKDAQITPLKILSRPKVSYSDSARTRGITGSVNLLVEFSADGKIGNILVMQSLENGLDQNAIKAAKNIKFEPQKQNGTPISVVKVIEFSFLIY
jgi:TonB family protein